MSPTFDPGAITRQAWLFVHLAFDVIREKEKPIRDPGAGDPPSPRYLGMLRAVENFSAPSPYRLSTEDERRGLLMLLHLARHMADEAIRHPRPNLGLAADPRPELDLLIRQVERSLLGPMRPAAPPSRGEAA